MFIDTHYTRFSTLLVSLLYHVYETVTFFCSARRCARTHAHTYTSASLLRGRSGVTQKITYIAISINLMRRCHICESTVKFCYVP